MHTWFGSLSPGDSIDVKYLPPIYSPYADYLLSVWTDVAGDMNPQNDTLVKNITVPKTAYDAGVYRIVKPDMDTTWINHQPLGLFEISVMVRNYGVNDITAMQLSYSYLNIYTISENWTGLLLAGDSMQFTFDSLFQSGLGFYFICARTQLSGDGNPTNDQFCRQYLGGVDSDEASNSLPVFLQNYPNPAGDKTLIEFSLPNSGKVVFEIRNLHGNVVYKEEKVYEDGRQMIELNTSSWPAGMYFYSLEYEQIRLSKKMILIKNY